MLVCAGLSPHPPIIIPEVGGPELPAAGRTVAAMKAWAKDMASTEPETLIFISPHADFLQGALGCPSGQELAGSFAAFGAPEVAFRAANDRGLAAEIASEAAREGIRVVDVNTSVLDHGVMVPLYYLERAGVSASLVVFGISLLPPERHYRFGQALARAVAGSRRRTGLVASGDLSHRLQPGAPAGYDPQGRVFDQTIADGLAGMDEKSILGIPEILADRAGECGLRPIIMLLGALGELEVKSRIYSYEGPFGVGYLVAGFSIRGQGGSAADRPPSRESRGRQDEGAQDEGAQDEGAQDEGAQAMSGPGGGCGPEERPDGQPSAPVRLARASLEHYLAAKELLPAPEPLPDGMEGRAGVFVSLKKHGQLRGCIGTIEPVRRNMAEEIIHNAVSAGMEDPRFWPLQPEELPGLTISVDVLAAPEAITSEDELDPKRYGVIVSGRGRVGLLLPNLEGIDTVAEQVAIARQKAGLRPDEPVRLARFEVIRYE